MKAARSKKHGDGREVSFIDAKVKEWLATEAPEDGLCLGRFKADVTAEGAADWQTGDVVQVDGALYQIAEVGKRCFAECGLLQRTGEKCPLAEGVAFGSVLKTDEDKL